MRPPSSRWASPGSPPARSRSPIRSTSDQRSRSRWTGYPTRRAATGAYGCYQHALDLRADTDDEYRYALTLDRLGDTHHDADNPQSAHDAWQHALTILTDLDRPDADTVRAKLDNLGQPEATSTG